MSRRPSTRPVWPPARRSRRAIVKLPRHAPRHLVHAEDVRLKGFQSGVQGLGAMFDYLLQVEAEVARVVMPVAILAQGRECTAIYPGGIEEVPASPAPTIVGTVAGSVRCVRVSGDRDYGAYVQDHRVMRVGDSRPTSAWRSVPDVPRGVQTRSCCGSGGVSHSDAPTPGATRFWLDSTWTICPDLRMTPVPVGDIGAKLMVVSVRQDAVRFAMTRHYPVHSHETSGRSSELDVFARFWKHYVKGATVRSYTAICLADLAALKPSRQSVVREPVS